MSRVAGDIDDRIEIAVEAGVAVGGGSVSADELHTLWNGSAAASRERHDLVAGREGGRADGPPKECCATQHEKSHVPSRPTPAPNPQWNTPTAQLDPA
ncbi:hypothetical protein GCM10027579_14740 [Calidifontibacter terrae]